MSKKKTNAKSNSGIDLLDRDKTDKGKPKKYSVVFYNDDYTPMDFVWDLLMRIYKHSPTNAYNIMLCVHNEGKGIAGVYSKEIAITKVNKSIREAKNAGHPLLCKAEPI